ncbi:MAG: hypothetical protein R3310_01105 [Candidatus Competibacteraceae bacterium]|nr:hypothetical protein [Candidatus Competibacteraceae bacterium]
MSRTVKEIYERLTGINLLRLRVDDLVQNQRELRQLLLDHERRLIRLEEQGRSALQLPPTKR